MPTDIDPSAVHWDAPEDSTIDPAKVKWSDDATDDRELWNNRLVNNVHAIGSGLYHNVVGGYKGIADIATGKGWDTAADDVNDEVTKTYHAPDDSTALEKKYDTLRYDPVDPQKIADYLADKSADAGAYPAVSTAIKSAPTALAALTGVRGLLKEAPAAIEKEAALPSSQSSSRQSMGAAQVNPSPFTLTGQETGRGSPWFPQVKLAKNARDVPDDEQSTRAQIVREVLNDSGEEAGIRTGVLTGNEQTLRSEYQAAKNPNQSPANSLMADQIAAEQRALPKFAQQRIDATGADPTLTNDYQRGETINNAFFGH